MSEAVDRYKQALKNRRNGIMSELGPEATFAEIKSEFYADSRVLSEDALKVFNGLPDAHPPYGLVGYTGTDYPLKTSREPWQQISRALQASGHTAFEQATPSITACPYHETLARKLGNTITTLAPFDNNELGLDTLRAVATPGAELNAPLFVSLARRVPAIQRLHGSNGDSEAFARNSVSLLREPLGHPQQWAL